MRDEAASAATPTFAKCRHLETTGSSPAQGVLRTRRVLKPRCFVAAHKGFGTCCVVIGSTFKPEKGSCPLLIENLKETVTAKKESYEASAGMLACLALAGLLALGAGVV